MHRHTGVRTQGLLISPMFGTRKGNRSEGIYHQPSSTHHHGTHNTHSHRLLIAVNINTKSSPAVLGNVISKARPRMSVMGHAQIWLLAQELLVRPLGSESILTGRSH